MKLGTRQNNCHLNGWYGKAFRKILISTSSGLGALKVLNKPISHQIHHQRSSATQRTSNIRGSDDGLVQGLLVLQADLLRRDQ